MKLERILVGVDGSPNSLAAVEWAGGLARLVPSEVIAVHALGLLERLDDERPVAVEAHRDEIRQRFEEVWTAPLEDAEVTRRLEMRYGRPADVLLAVSEDADVDLVVVGTRGVGARSDLLLGSTSAEVAQRCRRPVVVVPHPTGGR